MTAQLEPWARVVGYLIVVGVCLEYAHRIYWFISKWAGRAPLSVFYKSFVISLAANLPLLIACGVTFSFCVFVDKESLETLGLRFDLKPGTYVAGGATIAFISVALIFLIGYYSGWIRVYSSRISGNFHKSLPTVCGGITEFATASIFEELIMRGYVFSILYSRLGPSHAVIGSAAIFSLFHLVKHTRLPLLFTINAFFFGILAAQSRLATGALWMPIGLHIGWNFAASSVFGLPCAGRIYDGGLITCTVDGPKHITGGYYSPDAGLLGTVGIVFAASALVVLTPFV
ncbi:MAG: CPBP family intramembrane metalloprotease [Armatimonadota bacterium]|nr:CPBP family intramembrane metalloprotease [Armatimonadota bacterium]